MQLLRRVQHLRGNPLVHLTAWNILIPEASFVNTRNTTSIGLLAACQQLKLGKYKNKKFGSTLKKGDYSFPGLTAATYSVVIHQSIGAGVFGSILQCCWNDTSRF